jgi:nucleoside-diphosphate-sugar epimerase
MNVLITGGGGFLGRRLTDSLLERGRLTASDGIARPIERLTLLDLVPAPPHADARVAQIAGDIADRDLLERAVDGTTSSIFHLAAVVSGMAETDFDLGMRVNVDASRMLLDVCRARGHRPRMVFASSVAVYGGDHPNTVDDLTVVRPQSSYGTQKAIVELLMEDYTRRGFVDGRVLRLPTISVRPGRPNAAASSFASGIIREPLTGEEAVCPVAPDTRLWLLSPATAVECFIAVHEADPSAFGASRVVNAPGLSVTAGEMIEALGRIAGPDVARRVRVERDPRVERIVGSWPGSWDPTRARLLGLPGDDSFDTIVRRYIEETLTPAPPPRTP